MGAESVSIMQTDSGEKFHQSFSIVLVSVGGGFVGKVHGVLTVNPANGLENVKLSGECDGPIVP